MILRALAVAVGLGMWAGAAFGVLCLLAESYLRGARSLELLRARWQQP